MRALLAIALVAAAAAWSAPPEFSLRDTGGALHTPAEWRGHPLVVLFFVTTDCPVTNRYVPEMNRIREAYAARGVLFFAVQSDVTIPEPKVVGYARDFRYGYPLLLDPRQTLVRLAGATTTAQVAVLTAEAQLLYLGRIDNRVEDFGSERPAATESDLREALDAVLAGKPVPHPRTKSIGCAINRVADPEADALPPGDGKPAVVKVCTVCHGVGQIRKQRLDKADWSDTVAEMTDRGAQADEKEIDAIIDYLAAQFGTNAQVQMNTAPIPELKTVLGFTTDEAAAIVARRQQHGPFRDWRDVAQTPGADAAKVEAQKQRMAFQ
jgi:mono/diheme cytochrome c family protein/peroxiredoxin